MSVPGAWRRKRLALGRKERQGALYLHKGDSIFDVVMKVESIDFEAAKIRALEMIGRTDIIRIKDSKGKKYQKTDAASLLNAPADNRDDKLPLVYLAHRLDIPIEQVTVPGRRSSG